MCAWQPTGLLLILLRDFKRFNVIAYCFVKHCNTLRCKYYLPQFTLITVSQCRRSQVLIYLGDGEVDLSTEETDDSARVSCLILVCKSIV